ncbi:MAG: hypothetical protein WAN65_31385 [Candidatus Sulfotelmatobacter sp.]
MIEKLLVLLLLLAPWTMAHASLTEIRKDFLNETSLLPATPVITAPTVDASYLICVAVGDVQTSVPNAILRWTDENGQLRSFTYPTVNGVPNGCNLIRNRANTAATLETDGPYSGFYNLFGFGFGFWPSGTQAQGGVKETLNYSIIGANGGYEFSFPGSPWLFSVVASSSCKWQLSAGWSGVIVGAGSQISTGYGGGNGSFTTLTLGCSYSLRAIQFGSPALGSGPLTDYEYNLLDWTNATYPKLKAVFVAGSVGANILLATNIAERPTNDLVSEALLVYWNNETSMPCAASIVGKPSGAPGSCISPIYIEPGGSLQFLTYNQPGQKWGASPTYSSEVDIVQF